MNDKFLYEARPGLRKEFADELYARISNDESIFTRFLDFSNLAQKKLKLGIAIMIGVVIIVACTRLLLEPRNVQVGTIWVQEGSATRTVKYHFQEQDEPVLSSPGKTIPIDDAIAMLPFKMKIPEWTPDEFSLAEDTILPPVPPAWNVTLTWINSQNNQIMLFVGDGQVGELHVPRGMWKEIRVNGLPAVLVRGNFPLSQLPPPDSPKWEKGFEWKWDKNAGLNLVWSQEGALFSLQTFGNYLDKDDLIRMAESMRTW